MAQPKNGKGQTDTKLISQGANKAEVVLITTYPDGSRTSRTAHYRIQGGKFVENARVNDGRHKQRENGRRKPWQQNQRRKVAA